MPSLTMVDSYDLSSIDLDAQLLDINRADYEGSLYLFLKAAWPYIDSADWKDGWHIDAICEHLQAVVDGKIRRLIINLPPRHCKSILLSVAFPAWVWIQQHKSGTSGPGVPFLYASYNDKLSLRDSVKCRRLIESPWFQRLWGNRFALVSDQNTKSRFTNDKGGDRLITSIDAGVTGEGGNIICIDDPLAANDIASAAAIENVIDWWTTAMPTRLNDPETGAYIIIMQRLAQTDLTGYILENEIEGWTHLCLPGRFEPDRAMTTSIGWSDPRTVEGQLLWPERFSEASLKRLEKTMGPWTFNGQIQQRPQPKGGGIIKEEWWMAWKGEKFPQMDYILAVLDTAYTEDTMRDPSGMMIWGVFTDEKPPDATSWVHGDVHNPSGLQANRVSVDHTSFGFAPRVMLLWAWDEHLELHELVSKVAKTCVEFKVDQLVIENKGPGISVAQEIRRLYNREKFGVELFDPKAQDKTARLYSVQHIFAEHMVWAPDERPWVNRVIDQIAIFPKGKHDEYVDLTSMGLRKLRDMGLLVRAPEREADIEENLRYVARQEPLYAV
jgi:predicted phage terminase large subunit-like protein